MISHPVFVVVGHPNKGKSSIVSALTMDDSISISDTPGTTKHSRSFSLKIDGKVYYELIDTPGFQRPRRLLKYLKSFGEVSALERPKLLKQFYHDHKDEKTYHDECELIKPIIDGAGIIYVVDASKPFSKEYEMEMEILRYSGNPSMAILNYIGDEDFTKEWDLVLGQYFRLVKKFDPIHATKSDHIELMEALIHINPMWQDSMKDVIKYLKEYNDEIVLKISKAIVESVKEVLSYKFTAYFKDDFYEDIFLENFKKKIKDKEKSLFKKIRSLLRFKSIDFEVEEKGFEFDLFSSKSKEIFGLKREKLLLLSAISGGVLGGGVDLALGGQTLFLGSVIGALGAVASTLYGFDEISKIKFISKSTMQIGPIKNINFGFIYLNRALVYAKMAMKKSHADRKNEFISFENIDGLIKDEDIKVLAKIHSKFKDQEDTQEDREKYVSIVKNILKDER